ncbi:chemotaxis protein CheA [Anaerotruncus colihominis]|uniref:Chemotaxis protein CheA n=1 Tax=Anaerotruncus colihominis TaxID=169435 RepID=A0A845SQ41_9FIRM|nr:chemotaxis protein CheA [Anaerotruncus colihominis]MCR2024283.1 chemotaxis protein CheA [Anaerotruncus colihominis]NDO39169.1 chemotaxis protein CheA [Anaerotruncus colihominis]
MAIDPSMEPMLDVFIYETTTLLDQLDEILLDAEKSKSFSEDNINEIFRIMHTIKGSAAMMDLNGISTLAHSVEDVFFIIREDPARMANISEAIFDLVFQASDFLKDEVECVQNTREANKDPGAIIAELEKMAAIMKGESPAADAPAAPAADEAAPTAQASASEQDDETCHIRIFFDDDCQMENIRAFMLVSQLKDLCTDLTTIPANPENDASCCTEIIKNGFEIIFKPLVPISEIFQVVESSVNVKNYTVLHDEPAPPPAAAAAEPAQAPAKAAAAPAKPAAAAPSAPKPSDALPKTKQSLVSVNQAKLDQLMDLVGELVTTESMVVSNPDLKGLRLDNFNKSTRELHKLTDELQDVVMSIRMVPLSGIFQKMNRIVRDMSKKLDKQVELVTEGGDTEVDKTINEAIGDPFMHMIRNSMDHGIEPIEERRAKGKPDVGRITMIAKNIGSEIVITIADDGAGLNPEVLLRKARENGLLTKPESEYTDKEIFGLIMLPGFSTNKEVTEFSGRGVGMDVVRKNIEKVGGTLSIDSERDKGTTFIIKIPLTLAIVDGMELEIGNTIYTLPIASITQSFKIYDNSQILHNTDGTEMIMLRGECFPLIRLHRLFDVETQITELGDGIVILIENGANAACLFADKLLGEQQVVVKPFPTFLNKYAVKQIGLSGCTILGDGSISLILDANALLNLNKERR